MVHSFIIELHRFTERYYDENFLKYYNIEILQNEYFKLCKFVDKKLFKTPEIIKNFIINTHIEIQPEKKRLEELNKVILIDQKRIRDYAKKKGRPSRLTKTELIEFDNNNLKSNILSEILGLIGDTEHILTETLVVYFPDILKNKKNIETADNILSPFSIARDKYPNILGSVRKKTTTKEVDQFKEIFKNPDHAQLFKDTLREHPDKLINQVGEFIGIYQSKKEIRAVYQALSELGKLRAEYNLKYPRKNKKLAELFKKEFQVNVSTRTLNNEPELDHLDFYLELFKKSLK